MRNRYEGPEHDERSFNERPRSYGDGWSPGHERGFGMANGRERDPHRVDDRYAFDRGYDPYGSNQGPGYAPAHFEPVLREEHHAHHPQGRLPKNYTRSDDRIREDVCENLGMQVDASEVEVTVVDGVVSLTGSVIDRSTKYQLEEISERVLGVRDVQNHVTILRGVGSSLAATQRMDPPRRSRH